MALVSAFYWAGGLYSDAYEVSGALRPRILLPARAIVLFLRIIN